MASEKNIVGKQPEGADKGAGRSIARGYVASILAIFALSLVLFTFLGSRMLESTRELARSHKERYSIYLLAEELRSSSEDLTKFIRLYAATGDPYFKALYFDVLDIRNGLLPAPANYRTLNWDILVPERQQPVYAGDNIPLAKRLQQAGLTPGELALLTQAEAESNALTDMELLAMRAIEGHLSEEERQLLAAGESGRDFARRILNGQAYLEAKARIMAPFGELYALIDARMAERVEAAERQSGLYLRLFLLMLAAVAVIMLLLVGRAFNLFRKHKAGLEELVESRTIELKHHKAMTITDPMLGIYNRRGFLREMEKELERIARHGQLATLLLIDIDKFKEVNDTLGHFKADGVLKDFVDRTRSQLRASDVFGRLGGDEFGILCTATPLDEGIQVARRILDKISGAPVLVDGNPYTYTVSIGLVELRSAEGHQCMHDLLHKADKALYKSKNSGRNRYTVED